MLAFVSSLALNLYPMDYRSITRGEKRILNYAMNQDNLPGNERLYIGINTLKSREGDTIQFKKPLTVSMKKEEELFLLEWTEDKDVFGMGETIEEAQEDLLYNIEGILAMKDFDESELSSEAKDLMEKLASHIEVIK